MTAGGSPLSDTWTWDGNDWTQKTPVASPSGRIYHGMATDSTGRPVLFGGCTGSGTACSGPDNQTWQWSGTNWTVPCGTAVCGTTPSSRAIGAMATDRSGKVVLFGGFESWFPLTFTNNTWVWNGNNSTWTAVTVDGVKPYARSNAMMAPLELNGKWGLLLFGGGNGSGLYSDTWFFVLDSSGTPPDAGLRCRARVPRRRLGGWVPWRPIRPAVRS